MTKPEGIDEIKKSCNAISRELMRIHPAVAVLENKEAQDDMFKILFELTKNVESIKKLMRKLDSNVEDGSRLL